MFAQTYHVFVGTGVPDSPKEQRINGSLRLRKFSLRYGCLHKINLYSNGQSRTPVPTISLFVFYLNPLFFFF